MREDRVSDAIPHAIAMVRSDDKKSPRESVEFILQLLKVSICLDTMIIMGTHTLMFFWLAASFRSVGELEFGWQSIIFSPSLLKRVDCLLQFDRLMPSHNGILTINCIQSLTRIAVKLSEFIPLDRVIEFIKPYWASKTWQIQVDAGRALLELEFQCHGIDAALMLFIRYVKDEMSLRGQVKLAVTALCLCQMTGQCGCDKDVKSETLVAFLHLLESPVAFNNMTLCHYIFCILQVLAGRAPTLYGVPRDETLRMGHTKTSNELKNIFASLIKQSAPTEPSSGHSHVPLDLEGQRETDSENHEQPKAVVASPGPDRSVTLGACTNDCRCSI